MRMPALAGAGPNFWCRQAQSLHPPPSCAVSRGIKSVPAGKFARSSATQSSTQPAASGLPSLLMGVLGCLSRGRDASECGAKPLKGYRSNIWAWFVTDINLNTAADAALRPFTAGTFCIKQFTRERDLTNRLHVYIWLHKTYIIPAGLYASQVRATPLLRQGKEMDNPLQKWLLTVLKRILMVKDTTPSWCVMREWGLEPLQFNWFRVAVRLYNTIVVL